VLAAAAQVAKEGQPRTSWVVLVGASLLVAIPGVVAASAWGQQRRAETAKLDEIAKSRAAERRTHFATAARGVAQPHWTGSLFTGRERALRALAAWLADDSAGSLRIVIGQPGSGKSAVLGRVVELSSPATRKTLAVDTPPDCLPPARCVHLELTARGRTLLDLVAQIAAEVRLTAGSVDELILGLRDRKAPLVVVLDGLNESAEPQLVARELIGRLADREDGIGLRMVVGSRPSLLRSIRVSDEEIIDLDGPDYFEPADLVEYTRKCLREFTRADGALDPATTRDIAAGIAERAGKAFLVAQLTARAISRDIDCRTVRWRERFPDNVGAAMEAYLDRIPDGQRARTLLMPLAFAKGDGLAPDMLWAELATTLGTESVTEQDVRWLIHDSPASSLITKLATACYHLYHEAFAEHLRNTCPHESPHGAIVTRLRSMVAPDWSAAHPYIREHLATHAAQANTIDELLSDSNYLGVAAAAPLLRALSHVATPAARQAAEIYRGVAHHIRRQPDLAAFYLELYARQRGYDRLADAWVRGLSERPLAVQWARCRVSQPHRVIGRHETDIGALHLIASGDFAVSGDSEGAVNLWDVVNGVPIVEEIRLSPATVINEIATVPVSGGLVLLVASDGGLYTIRVDTDRDIVDIVDVACVDKHPATTVSVLEREGLIVAGYRDGGLRLWELASAARVVSSVIAHPEGIISTGTGTVDGEPVVISAGFSGSVTLWVLMPDGLQRRRNWYGTVPLASVLVFGSTENPLVVGGGEDGTVHAWQVSDDEYVATVRCADESPASMLSLVRLRDRELVLTGGFAGEISVWDPTGGARLAGPLSGHMGWVTALDAASRGARDTVLSGGDDGYVRCWNLDLGLLPERSASTGDTAAVTAMEVVANGTSLVLCGRADGMVFVLDAESGADARSPLDMSRHGVRCLRAARLADGWAVLSGSYDGTLNAVSLDGKPLIDAPIRAHDRAFRSLCVFRGVVLTGGDGGVVVWDPKLWRPAEKPFDADPEVYAVAATRADGRDVLICGGYAGIHLVDLATGRRVAGPLLPDRLCRALTVTELNGRPVVVSAGETGVQFWDPADGTPTAPPVLTDEVAAVAEVNVGDGRAVAWGDQRGVTLWSLAERRELARIDLGFAVTSVAGCAADAIVVSALHGIYRLDVRLDGEW
jgi:WD40 repeat protein